MAFKLNKTHTSVLVSVLIAFLLAVIILVWVQFGQGAFRSKKRSQNPEHVMVPMQQHSNTTTINLSKEFIERTYAESDSGDSNIEFVKPLKINRHELPPGYEYQNNAPSNHERPPTDRPNGHFRHKQSDIWDPNPIYEIHAFGEELFLDLSQNNKFVSPSLHVTHVWDNYSHRRQHDRKLSGCFYTGHVQGDENSDVAVSLCNGMTGYIRTSEHSYYIKPIQVMSEDGSTMIHELKRMPHGAFSENPTSDITQCEVNDAYSLMENNSFIDEFVEDEIRYHRKKRSISNTPLSASPPQQSLRSKRGTNWLKHEEKRQKKTEYFVKLLVVADHAMIKNHNPEELDHFILVIMSNVAALYEEIGIGSRLSLSVVDIHILRDDMEWNTLSDSQKILGNFCNWQKRITRERQHDAAILLTGRYDAMKTLGTAFVGSMCKPESSCALITDRGLATSYTVAHEIGHLLSMRHDEDTSCDRFHKTGRGERFIMSKTSDTKPWLWSQCSRHFLGEFLKSKQAKCLLIPPKKKFQNRSLSKLPGEMFEADKQCQLDFGPHSSVCFATPLCEKLWCYNEEEGNCMTRHTPWAEGTPCGPKSMCHHGECVAVSRDIFLPIDGGWGAWEPWGHCSRTCGGGIRISKRFCDSPSPQNGGAFCAGNNQKFESCNTQPCKQGHKTFREVQCSHFNDRKKHYKNLPPNLPPNVKWVPVPVPENPCKLFCKAKHSDDYKLEEDVLDGTKCGADNFGICVNGVCHPGGCDNVLGSNATLDECGICGGDNSRCEEITGTHNYTVYGYSKVVRIPKGSSNLIIEQRGYGNTNEDFNYLALVDGETGQYILNGNNQVSSFEKDVTYSGVSLSYTGSTSIVEKITTHRHQKLAKDLVLEVLSVGEFPPDISYRYVISRDDAPRFAWRLYDKQWSECSSVCSGTRHKMPVCVEIAFNKQVDRSYCSELDMQSAMVKQPCNTHCQLVWNVISKDECSKPCGKGIRRIYYNCVKFNVTKYSTETIIESTDHEVVGDQNCLSLPEPPTLETCYNSCDSTRWSYSQWSECTQSCGGGIQRRIAKCMDSKNNLVADSECDSKDKVEEQICNTQKCPFWSSGDWSACSSTCGRGFRTRKCYCNIDGHIYNEMACNSSEKPTDREDCALTPCVQWSAGSWSACSTNCGEGTQRRDVLCKNSDTGAETDYQHCDHLLKPNDTKICSVACNINKVSLYEQRHDYIDDKDNTISFQGYNLKYRWVTGPWSQCSTSCGEGIRTRQVVCKNEYGLDDEYFCDKSIKPTETMSCHNKDCAKWTYDAWSDCDLRCVKYRSISCKGPTGNLLDDSKCDIKTRPLHYARCKQKECFSDSGAPISKNSYHGMKQRYKWAASKFKICSKTCGRGQKKRTVTCRDRVTQEDVDELYCSTMRKPRLQKPCERYKCDYAWLEDQWSDCSANCGEGEKYRNVTCHKVYGNGIVDPNPTSEQKSDGQYRRHYCDKSKKPPMKAPCLQSDCNDIYVWKTGPWSTCSSPCGKKGRQERQVDCTDVRNGVRIHGTNCPKEFRPMKKRRCNQFPCLYNSCKEVKRKMKAAKNKEYLLKIHDKPALIYCFKMDTDEPEEYITLKQDNENYAEFYDKRLQQVDTCPYGGQRNQNCPCTSVSSPRSGFTYFWKIRLNITSLQIIGDDFTFSAQRYGKPIPYGTSGDCYSSVKDCAQGRFSIDLSGTLFHLSSDVRWHNIGQNSVADIRQTNNGVKGRCGGYCGNCAPDPNIGLQVEIT